MAWLLIYPDQGKARRFESKSEAEAKREQLEELLGEELELKRAESSAVG